MAEEQLSRAEGSAAEALEAARAVGVITNDIPDSAQNHYKIETISANVGSATHKVSATFETAFAVDKQVAAAVKAAFVKLANCHSINKDEFKELLHKISENPDTDETCSDLSAIISECDSDACSDMEAGSCKDSLKKQKKRPESYKFNTANIVDMILCRLQCLKEDELASLATIVATSGLSAALAETENPCPKVSGRMSVGGRTAKNSLIPAHSRGTADAELPSLDQFLVKRLTRLEREVLEAKNARKNEAIGGSKESDGEKLLSADDSRSKVKIKDDGTSIPDLGSILLKHSSKLEKEIEEARRMHGKSSEINKKKSERGAPRAEGVVDIPSLDKYLVKRLTRLEMEIQEARMESTKENIALNKIESRDSDTEVRFLEDQKCKRKEAETDPESGKWLQREEKEKDEEKGAKYESLDKVLVKHVSRLEKAKSEYCADETMQRRVKRKEEEGSREQSLDEVLVKHKSRLEKEKMGGVEADNSSRYSVCRRQAREQELQAAWGGLSLGNSMRPHVSRLQRDKVKQR